MIRQPGGQEKKSQRGGRDASQRRTRKKSSKSNNRSKAKNNGATPNSSPFQSNRPSLGGSPHVPRALSYNNEFPLIKIQNRNSRRRLQLQTRRHFTIITSECLLGATKLRGRNIKMTMKFTLMTKDHGLLATISIIITSHSQ
jgi:hypothetical protein